MFARYMKFASNFSRTSYRLCIEVTHVHIFIFKLQNVLPLSLKNVFISFPLIIPAAFVSDEVKKTSSGQRRRKAEAGRV